MIRMAYFERAKKRHLCFLALYSNSPYILEYIISPGQARVDAFWRGIPGLLRFEPLGGIPGLAVGNLQPSPFPVLLRVAHGKFFRNSTDLSSKSNCIAIGIIPSPLIASCCHWIKSASS